MCCAAGPKVCSLGALVTPALEAWLTVPIDSPPAGRLACVLLRPDADRQVMGVIRVKSVDKTVPDYQQQPYAHLLQALVKEYAAMGVAMSQSTWEKDRFPVSGPAGFGRGIARGYSGRIRDNPVPQEINAVLFQGPDQYYVLSLMTPARQQFPEQWEINQQAFAALIQGIQFPADQ